jgi:hypothetical protein
MVSRIQQSYPDAASHASLQPAGSRVVPSYQFEHVALTASLAPAQLPVETVAAFQAEKKFTAYPFFE